MDKITTTQAYLWIIILTYYHSRLWWNPSQLILVVIIIVKWKFTQRTIIGQPLACWMC